jgi:hypothetical protein
MMNKVQNLYLDGYSQNKIKLIIIIKNEHSYKFRIILSNLKTRNYQITKHAINISYGSSQRPFFTLEQLLVLTNLFLIQSFNKSSLTVTHTQVRSSLIHLWAASYVPGFRQLDAFKK